MMTYEEPLQLTKPIEVYAAAFKAQNPNVFAEIAAGNFTSPMAMAFRTSCPDVAAFIREGKANAVAPAAAPAPKTRWAGSDDFGAAVPKADSQTQTPLPAANAGESRSTMSGVISNPFYANLDRINGGHQSAFPPARQPAPTQQPRSTAGLVRGYEFRDRLGWDNPSFRDGVRTGMFPKPVKSENGNDYYDAADVASAVAIYGRKR